MRYVVFLVLLMNLSAFGQALHDINYSFQYDPTEPFSFSIKALRSSSGWSAYYAFTLRDSSQRTDQYLLQWELRTTLDEKQGTTLDPSAIEKIVIKNELTGVIKLPASANPQYLTVRILNNVVKRVWMFYKALPPNYPADGYLTVNGHVVQQPYAKVNVPVVLGGIADASIVSFYNDDFPAAVPAFSEGMGRVARNMKVDTTYAVAPNTPMTFAERGLYLVQKDTSATEGFAFRIENDYPRLAKIESLADPLIYVCTKQEFTRVKEAKGDKKAFDKVILSITGSSDRAKDFIRNYFKRVEWANTFFTSYKEGWKTDRGMIYILFGLPDELYRFSDREVWNYKSNDVKITFNFVKSRTLFDPENYVLIREKQFQETWYEKIDLWRNARF
ncbi:MAG TPA: GWxTD domain-containing protein [Chryseolinea sp.]|nr:GWxTD domain-containing protein [Chryseolinea sp.]